jgi:hypothetical protein
MNPVRNEEVKAYVKKHIRSFHQARLDSLKSLKLSEILRNKNPYLFKAKNITLAQDLVKTILDAHLSSQEETMFGDFLEGLAIFVGKQALGGWKSSARGIDLEFDRDGTRFIMAIKSGPNWGNSSQVEKMKLDFRRAKQTLHTSNSGLNVIAVNGCCYGRTRNADRGDYYKYCGQKFWEFISGNSNLYLEIIEPLGFTAKERNAEFHREYSQIVNRFTAEFSQKYVLDGAINWNALVEFNSSEKQIQRD